MITLNLLLFILDIKESLKDDINRLVDGHFATISPIACLECEAVSQRLV